MKILRIFYYSFIFLIIMTIAVGFYILSNSDLFNSSEQTVHIVQAPAPTRLPPTNAPITPDEQPNQASFIDLMTELNAVRSSAGAPVLTLNSKLNAAAAVQALYNSQIGKLSHDGPNGDRVQNRVEAQGYSWHSLGENLLSRWDINRHQVFKQWQNSPKHNENMMNPKFTEVGLAYMITSEGEVFYVMVLGRPR